MRTAGCRVVVSDTASQSDPTRLWYDLACADASRYTYQRDHGDRRRTATGVRQRNDAFRRLQVEDGDDYWGERCELGNNWRDQTFEVYRAGDRRITFVSLRLPRRFPLGTEMWQLVVQMKQVQPADNGSGTPVLALHAYDGRWRLLQSASPGPASTTRQLWSTRARKRVWTRIGFDVSYSDSRDAGVIKMYIDANGDGDALDRNERSGAIRTYTLKTETANDSSDGIDDDGVPEGQPIPSHLRVGLYHDSEIGCSPPSACTVDVDNVQVLAPR